MQNFKIIAYLLLGFFCVSRMLWRLYCNVMAAILILLIIKASLATAEVSAWGFG
jgi:hypothetical protein